MINGILWLLGILFGISILVIGWMVVSSIFNATGASFTAVDKSVSNQFYTRDNIVYFVSGGNFFSLGEVEIEGADAGTFEVLSENHARDRHSVYYQGKILEQVSNITSFLALDSFYSKDDSKVYLTDTELSGTDVASFEVIESLYSKDKFNVFYFREVIENADPETFQVLWSNFNGNYSQDNSHVYFGTNRIASIEDRKPQKVPGDKDNRFMAIGEQLFFRGTDVSNQVDTGSIQIINERYLIDKDNVYYVYSDIQKFENSAPESFELIDEISARDQNNVYIMSNILDGENPAKYRSGKYKPEYKYQELIVGENRIKFVAKSDLKSIGEHIVVYQDKAYFGQIEIEFADIGSLKALDHYYSRDANRAYYREAQIKGVDLNSFEILSSERAKDKNRAYFGKDALLNSDPESFKSIDDTYFATDKNNVFYRELSITDVSPNTFKYQSGMYAEETSKGIGKLVVP